ncbi:HNHc domain containing protein [uncultured Caudovirales phage]|uniref:HNHc domain containing protein n=1 Tax=uncultured Caudovirales phage TaxID=2100421 RepID=A0A6J5RC71_9CAUD|nr:HNHc domain containing protein [uncultured Caudovirales phage]
MKGIDREALFSRCKGMCEKCGGALPESWAAHHRKLRKHGGKDDINNVLALHHECHNLGTDSVHLNPKNSYANGWLVSAYADHATAPVKLAGNWWVILTEDGDYEGSPGPEGEQ